MLNNCEQLTPFRRCKSTPNSDVNENAKTDEKKNKKSDDGLSIEDIIFYDMVDDDDF